MRHHAKFHQNRSNGCRIWRFNGFFQNGGRPPSWICWAPIGTTHDDHLVVSIVVQNLVEIDALVSITLYNSIVPPGLCTGTLCSASQETVQALFPLQMTSPEHQVT